MKTIQKLMVYGLILGMLLVCASSTRATLIINSTPTGTGFSLADLTMGVTMTSASAITITQLGVEDLGLNGLADAHDIGLWTNGVLATSTTISAGTVDPLIGDWRFVTLSSPVTIDPGVQFTIAALTSAGDSFYYDSGGVPIDPSISGLPGGPGNLTGGAYYYPSGGILTPPNTSWVPNYWVNADFTAAAVVPEPSAVALLALGAVLIRRWRKS